MIVMSAREIAKVLERASSRHDMYRVFSDSVEMMALAMANGCDPSRREIREARYLEIVRHYEREEVLEICTALPRLAMAMEAERADYLGEVFMQLELGSDFRGQFFTPYEVSRFMARLTLAGDVEGRFAERWYVTIHEPAVGAGGMVIAMADELHRRGVNYQRHCHVTCIDVDARAVHMAYIQLSLIGMPAIVIHGNALTEDAREYWYTPMHILGGWSQKLRESATTHQPSAAEPAALPGGQLELFA